MAVVPPPPPPFPPPQALISTKAQITALRRESSSFRKTSLRLLRNSSREIFQQASSIISVLAAHTRKNAVVRLAYADELAARRRATSSLTEARCSATRSIYRIR